MIPAWHHCPSGWTVQYTGYMMSDHYTHNKATYECVDVNAESIPGSHANTGGLFYYVEATCNGLPCPPYVTLHRKTDHFPQKLKFKLLLLVDTSTFAKCNGSYK